MSSASPAWRFGLVRVVAGAVVLAGIPFLSGPAAATSSPGPAASELFRLQDPTLDESSGLAVSARHRGIVWTHNDGGSVAQVLALDRRGRTRAMITLRGIDPFDPEALAPGTDASGRPALFLGDIGDNRGVRADVSVFRFREPARLTDQTVDAGWFRLRYPDGPRDAEALLVDPKDNRIWIATKDLLRGGLYRAPRRLRADRTNVLERVGEVPGLVTDGAFLPDGRLVLRSYATVYVYRAPGRLEAEASLPSQEQGESLAVDGERLLVGSEGVRSAVYAVPVPRGGATASSSPGTPSAPEPSPAAADPAPADRSAADSRFAWPPWGHSWRPAAFAAAVVLTVVAGLLRRRGSRRRATAGRAGRLR